MSNPIYELLDLAPTSSDGLRATRRLSKPRQEDINTKRDIVLGKLEELSLVDLRLKNVYRQTIFAAAEILTLDEVRKDFFKKGTSSRLATNMIDWSKVQDLIKMIHPRDQEEIEDEGTDEYEAPELETSHSIAILTTDSQPEPLATRSIKDSLYNKPVINTTTGTSVVQVLDVYKRHTKAKKELKFKCKTNLGYVTWEHWDVMMRDHRDIFYNYLSGLALNDGGRGLKKIFKYNPEGEVIEKFFNDYSDL